MLATNWLRSWRLGSGGQARRGQNSQGQIAQAALEGAGVERLIEIGANVLLLAGGADRSGVWLLAIGGGGAASGLVCGPLNSSFPQDWNHLELSAPSWKSLLNGREVVSAACGAGAAFPGAGALADMDSALWIPLRSSAGALGLAMVSFRKSPHPVDREALRSLGDELALAVELRRNAGRLSHAEVELETRARLLRVFLSDVNPEVVLAEVARAAALGAGAEFVAVARRETPSNQCEGWAGEEYWREALEIDAVTRVWRGALNESRPVESAITFLPDRVAPGAPRQQAVTDAPAIRLGRVVALPFGKCEGRALGVMLAGFSAAEGSSIAKRMDSYVAIASLALEREARQGRESGLSSALEAVMDSTTEWLLIQEDDGSIARASRAARVAFGLHSTHNRSARLEDLFVPGAHLALIEWREALAGQLPDAAVRPIDATMRDGLAVRINPSMRLRQPARSGAALEPATGRWLLCLEDLNVLKSCAADRPRIESELRALLDALDNGVLVFDEAGKIRASNDRFAQVVGLEQDRLQGLDDFDALSGALSTHAARPEEFLARWRDRRRRSGESAWDELEFLQPTRKIVERMVRPVRDPQGLPLGWIEVYRDITSQHLLQSKLLRTEKMAALGQLVSGIAHELNNPLTSIQGYAQLLLSRRPGPERSADAKRICQEAERAAKIVKNLLLFARESKPERRAVNLNEIVERTLALRTYELKVENIQAVVELESGLPPILAGAGQLLQVVLNLLVNAEQAIQLGRGRGKIRVRTRRSSSGRLALEVSDDGPGIPPEIISRIFDPFFTTKPVGVGTGLGLSIAYGIVQDHGGDILVESQPGRGATFTIELPAMAVAELDPAEDAQEQTSIASARPAVLRAGRGSRGAAPPPGNGLFASAASRLRILVVEDEPTVAQLIFDVLAEEGHRVDKLLDGREALERLGRQEYDLVICDLKMPNLDGRAFYKALADAANPLQHRFIFVTGDTMSPHTLEFLESSGVPFLAKPFLVEELKQIVHKASAGSMARVPVAASGGFPAPRAASRKR